MTPRFVSSPLPVVIGTGFLLASVGTLADVTLESLRATMTDVTAVARRSEPEFICRQASSDDRGTVAPDRPASAGARYYWGPDCVVLKTP